MAARILVEGGCVPILDAEVGNFPQTDALIEGSRIAAVEPTFTVADDEVIDAPQCTVGPGFVDRTPEHTDAAVAALQEPGIRAVSAYARPWFETGRRTAAGSRGELWQ